MDNRIIEVVKTVANNISGEYKDISDNCFELSFFPPHKTVIYFNPSSGGDTCYISLRHLPGYLMTSDNADGLLKILSLNSLGGINLSGWYIGIIPKDSIDSPVDVISYNTTFPVDLNDLEGSSETIMVAIVCLGPAVVEIDDLIYIMPLDREDETFSFE